MGPFCCLLLRTLIGFALLHLCLTVCYRKPQGATGDSSPVDENYQILIDGNPSTYMPGQKYNLTLECPPDLKFISFTLLLEADEGDPQMIGELQIIDNAETKFSDYCDNLIESSNNNIKHRVDIGWVAPDQAESGCVLFKAAVLQHRNVWFIDDGYLTKRLCREHIDEVHSQSPPVDPCCTCDEAKYEIVIERQWNRNTHPKGFPRDASRTRLGMLIGASHSISYKFWNYGEQASQGLQELAEHGASDALEKEIRNHSMHGHIRTIIKAPEIKYKLNAVSRTLATVRVGPVHHMISFVSKINPSPDWILGVAALELCLANCTWVERKELNMYPWDAGTDSGPDYMSADQAQKPPDVVRRITSTRPNDERSPFYDRSGAPIKPLAKLTVTRKRTYGRCGEIVGIPECATYPWNDWTECSAKCSQGMRYRERKYKDEALAWKSNCNQTLIQKEVCQGTCTTGAECDLRPWSEWTECSNRCGQGKKTRTRGFVNAYATENCRKNFSPNELYDSQTCEGIACGGSIGSTSSFANNDQDTMVYGFVDQQGPDNYFPERINTNFGSDNLRSQITRPTAMRYNNNVGNQYDNSNNPMRYNNVGNQYDNTNNIYGSKPPYVDNNQPLAGDLEQGYGERDIYGQQSSAFGLEQYTDKSMLDTTLRPQRGSSYTSPRSNFYNTPSSYEQSNQLNGAPYDNRNSNGEENFCLQIPYASKEECKATRYFYLNFWFYHPIEMECKIFTADSCDLNKNKFRTLKACEEACGGQQITAQDYQRIYGDGMNQEYQNGAGMNQQYQNGGGMNQYNQNRGGYGPSRYEQSTFRPYN